jgi:hypothetical protein
LEHVITMPVTKTDDEQMLVFGFANVSVTKDGELVTDTHGDQIPPDVLEKAAYKFVLKYREGGYEHEKMGVARLVESVFLTPEKLKAMQITDDTFKGAAWFLGFKVDDPDVWRDVKSGKLPAFSIGGTATFVEG